MKFHLVSLGCAKNLVDSEVVLGSLDVAGWQFTPNEDEADVLILNTCGFLQIAVEEAIDEILSFVEVKKKSAGTKLVVLGCLVQRYQEQLIEELPEVDLFVGTEGIAGIVEYLDQMMSGTLESKVIVPSRSLMTAKMPRVQTTPFFRAWVKITEGCDNHCSYCMIPSIRGPLRSRTVEDLVEEAIGLEKSGVKEISLIAQDLTAYGDDLNDSSNLVILLKQLLEKTTIPWIRLLYLYPSGLTDSLLILMAENPRIVRYLDIPVQHVSDSVLKSMNRPYGKQDLIDMVTKIRHYMPDIALRTTFLVGFPGETETDYQEISTFLEEYQIDHVGVFPYSNEQGSPSENFAHQLDEETKQDRCTRLLEVQQAISTKIQKRYVGTKQTVLVEGVSEETELLLVGRTQYQAPDVDGCVYINEGEVQAGDIVKVLVSESQQYDLVAGVL